MEAGPICNSATYYLYDLVKPHDLAELDFLVCKMASYVSLNYDEGQ